MKEALKRKIGNVIVVVIIIVFITTWAIYSTHRLASFKEAQINSVVVKSNDWWGKSIKYILADGNYIYFSVPVGNKIEIGDSVSKSAHSFVFRVYRKNEYGDYFFFKEYDYNEKI